MAMRLAAFGTRETFEGPGDQPALDPPDEFFYPVPGLQVNYGLAAAGLRPA